MLVTLNIRSMPDKQIMNVSGWHRWYTRIAANSPVGNTRVVISTRRCFWSIARHRLINKRWPIDRCSRGPRIVATRDGFTDAAANIPKAWKRREFNPLIASTRGIKSESSICTIETNCVVKCLPNWLSFEVMLCSFFLEFNILSIYDEKDFFIPYKILFCLNYFFFKSLLLDGIY